MKLDNLNLNPQISKINKSVVQNNNKSSIPFKNNEITLKLPDYKFAFTGKPVEKKSPKTTYIINTFNDCVENSKLSISDKEKQKLLHGVLSACDNEEVKGKDDVNEIILNKINQKIDQNHKNSTQRLIAGVGSVIVAAGVFSQAPKVYEVYQDYNNSPSNNIEYVQKNNNSTSEDTFNASSPTFNPEVPLNSLPTKTQESTFSPKINKIIAEVLSDKYLLKTGDAFDKFYVSQGWGSNHYGADITLQDDAKTRGTQLYAIGSPDKEIVAWCHDDFITGLTVTTYEKDSNSVFTYGHLDSCMGKTYEQIKAHPETFIIKGGQKIGRIGNTGESTGPHVHLQHRLIDPSVPAYIVGAKSKEEASKSPEWTRYAFSVYKNKSEYQHITKGVATLALTPQEELLQREN
ncbi:MAG: hypothetical protein WCK67_09020 [bacterium]